MGTKHSLELADADAPILFGDGTCVGLAGVYRLASNGAAARLIIEVGDLAQTNAVCTKLGIDDALLVERQADEGHLSKPASKQQQQIVLAGNAPLDLRGPGTIPSEGVNQ